VKNSLVEITISPIVCLKFDIFDKFDMMIQNQKQPKFKKKTLEMANGSKMQKALQIRCFNGHCKRLLSPPVTCTDLCTPRVPNTQNSRFAVLCRRGFEMISILDIFESSILTFLVFTKSIIIII
jgi:hypothetical protein